MSYKKNGEEAITKTLAELRFCLDLYHNISSEMNAVIEKFNEMFTDCAYLSEPSLHRFYFTFNDCKDLPYQNGYIIIIATSMKSAIAKFIRQFPSKKCYSEEIMCQECYTEEDWMKRAGKFYIGKAPFDTFI